MVKSLYPKEHCNKSYAFLFYLEFCFVFCKGLRLKKRNKAFRDFCNSVDDETLVAYFYSCVSNISHIKSYFQELYFSCLIVLHCESPRSDFPLK